MVASGGQFSQPLGMWAIQNDTFLEGQKVAFEVALRSEQKQNAELQKLLEKARLRSCYENNENLNGSSNSSNNSSASTMATPG